MVVARDSAAGSRQRLLVLLSSPYRAERPGVHPVGGTERLVQSVHSNSNSLVIGMDSSPF